jgi:hypothetical protein
MYAFVMWVGLTFGNVLYEVITHQNFSKAVMISYYQGFALLCYVFVSKVTNVKAS